MTSLERLKYRTGENDKYLLEDILMSAKSIILARLYPYGGCNDIPTRYDDLQLRIAEAMYNKIGADYQTGHVENGVSRSWGSEGVPKELLDEIVPMCGVIK